MQLAAVRYFCRARNSPVYDANARNSPVPVADIRRAGLKVTLPRVKVLEILEHATIH